MPGLWARQAECMGIVMQQGNETQMLESGVTWTFINRTREQDQTLEMIKANTRT